jgi:two-component system, OmpR family, sensor histidine kinase BaeS
VEVILIHSQLQIFMDNTNMRFKLHSKLVLAILLSISVVILIMLTLMSYSFNRSFKAHVLELEEQGDNLLITDLTGRYKKSGNWSFLQNDPTLWDELISANYYRPPHRPRIFKHGSQDRKPGGLKRPRPLPKPNRAILDLEKQTIAGTTVENENYSLKPILVNNQIIGYIAREPIENIISPKQEKFMQHLQKLFFSIAGISILVALIIAWVLSRHLLKPIRHISEGTTALAAGNYTQRINVSTNDELGDLSRHFNLLATTLEKNEKSRRQWVADISHELRTPLSILRGEIEALIDGVREVDSDRLQDLHKEILSLNRLIDDLHELSLSDIGALNYEKYSQDVIKILHHSISTLQPEFNSKSIAVDTTEIPKDPIKLFCDAQRIQQLFTNILSNSLSYTDSGGKLKIKTTTDNTQIVIDMLDSAPGVPDTELSRLFERLYRAESSRNRKTGGSGLGLSICKNIVEAHGGQIIAKTSSLGGIWISITFPLHRS